MEKFTLEDLKNNIEEFLENRPLTFENVAKFNALCEAKRNLCHMGGSFTEKDAEEWVQHMDPPARWTMEQTTATMHKGGYTDNPAEFYAVMNALFSDYGKTVAKHGLDKPDFWADLTHDFLNDQDAVSGKVERYWQDIVEH